ncbi:MAG: DUF2807 domain-containing protein [Chlorobi bacterium]|nr:DUF2807 domain-containing protein [Chlorobiota bacterium]
MKHLYFIISALFVFSSCNLRYTKGSGNIITENREVAPFSEINLKGSGNIVLTQGTQQQIEIAADDNIIPLISTEVRNGTLIISTKGGIIRPTKLNYDITIPEISSLKISGSGRIEGNEKISCEDLDLKISGSGNINLFVSAEEINAKISGSGKMKLKGASEDLEVKISGSGDLDAKDLLVENALIKVSGAGECYVNASENLNAHVSGSGNIYYIGNPDISTKISGSGSVQKRK